MTHTVAEQGGSVLRAPRQHHGSTDTRAVVLESSPGFGVFKFESRGSYFGDDMVAAPFVCRRPWHRVTSLRGLGVRRRLCRSVAWRLRRQGPVALLRPLRGVPGSELWLGTQAEAPPAPCPPSALGLVRCSLPGGELAASLKNGGDGRETVEAVLGVPGKIYLQTCKTPTEKRPCAPPLILTSCGPCPRY